jgi:hypothetical protein
MSIFELSGKDDFLLGYLPEISLCVLDFNRDFSKFFFLLLI